MPFLLALHSFRVAKIGLTGPTYRSFSFRPKACKKLAAQITYCFPLREIGIRVYLLTPRACHKRQFIGACNITGWSEVTWSFFKIVRLWNLGQMKSRRGRNLTTLMLCLF